MVFSVVRKYKYGVLYFNVIYLQLYITVDSAEVVNE
jgi:hypothetical protein